MEQKKKPERFNVFKNGARFSFVRAVSFEAAKGAAREKFAHMKGDYFELQAADGRFVPVY